MTNDFRHDLRDLTRPEHDRVDHALSALDLARAQDLVRFLGLHRACFGAMARACGAGSPTKAVFEDICARIDEDLATLGARPVETQDVDLGSVDPLALDYLLEGSRLGSKVLRTHWARATDPAVTRAARYFATPAPVARWRAVCDALSAIPTGSPRARRIVRDTKALFGLFETAQADFGLLPLRQAV